MKKDFAVVNDKFEKMPEDENLKKLECPKDKIDVGAGILDDRKIERYKRFLGANYNPQDYIAVDRVKLPGVDIACDITKGLPFKSETISEIICVHILEHIRNLESIMREFHRILKPGGVLKICVPHCFSPSAFGDSTHVRFFTFETFLQFDKTHPLYYYDFHFKFVRSRMQVSRRWYKPNILDKILEKIINRRQRSGERLLKILPYKDWEIYVELRKV